MSNYFEAQVSYLQQNEKGLIKAVKETYLIDALSFTEVEARLAEELESGGRNNWEVKSIRRSDVRELVLVGDTDLFFKVKFTFTVNDDESEKVKKITRVLLVNANDIDEATARTNAHLTTMLVPWEVTKAEKSKIAEVFQYVGKRPLIPADASNEEE